MVGVFATVLVACSGDESMGVATDVAPEDEISMDSPENPFMTPSELQFAYPRFDLIKNEHYEPAMLQSRAWPSS